MEKTYIIKVNAGSKEFTYTGKIISQDSIFLEFEDKYGSVFKYNLNHIISLEEIKEKEQ
jgi:hypothetical protein